MISVKFTILGPLSIFGAIEAIDKPNLLHKNY